MFLAVNWWPHSSLWSCATDGWGWAQQKNQGLRLDESRGPFLLRGMAEVFKALWWSSSAVVPHTRVGSAPNGAGFKPRSRHPDSSCIETVT